MTMSRWRRRLLIGALLFLLVAGTGLYYVLFKSTGAALRTSEAFAFRRMTVAQLAEQGTYRFFFATNRRKEAQDGPLE